MGFGGPDSEAGGPQVPHLMTWGRKDPTNVGSYFFAM